MSILIIDDNPDVKEIYETAADIVNADIQVINDGLKAIPLLAQTEVDAVLIDLAMPYLTGFKCVEQIRENEKLKFNQPPHRIAFFTAYNVDDVVREVQKEFNVERVFHKPIAPDELISEVRKWLNDA